MVQSISHTQGKRDAHDRHHWALMELLSPHSSSTCDTTSTNSKSSDSHQATKDSVHMHFWDLFNPLRGVPYFKLPKSEETAFVKSVTVPSDDHLYGEHLEELEGEDETEAWDFVNDDEYDDKKDDEDFCWASESPQVLKVTFEEKVMVKVIPSRHDYSNETKDMLWNNARSMNASMARNILEFVSDGRDWRSVAEEDVFAYLPSGELVHPATWIRTVAALSSPPLVEQLSSRRSTVTGTSTRSKRKTILDQQFFYPPQTNEFMVAC